MESKRSNPCTQQSATYPIQILGTYYFHINFNIILPSTAMSPKSSFPSSFPATNMYAFPISSVQATCSAHLILLDFGTLITSSEEYKL